MDNRTACQAEWEESGFDWSERTPYVDRGTLIDRALQCHKCPIREECYESANNQPFVTGIWGAYYWHDGKPIDPLGVLDNTDTQSVYDNVTYDSVKDKWRVRIIEDWNHYHLGVFANEDAAGARMWEWFSERGIDVDPKWRGAISLGDVDLPTRSHDSAGGTDLASA